MKFTVSRETWIRGNPHGSCLLKDNGHMCCLGFLARACGFSKGFILYRCLPDDIKKSDMTPEQSDFVNTDWHAVVSRNDEVNGTFAEQTREIQLKLLFLSRGHEVEFVD